MSKVRKLLATLAGMAAIMPAIRIALGGGWRPLVAGELIASTRGIGIIAALAFGFTLFVRLAESRLVPWYARS